MKQIHRSIRRYRPDPIPEEMLREILHEGLRASSSGNMQTWTVVLTRDPALRRELWKAHSEQDMVLEAPCTLTFCADFHRMRRWLKLRDAENSFDDLTGFLTATIDAIISAQTIAQAAETRGLGICYMGTTLWSAQRISEILSLPDHVVPVTSLVMGTPAEDPAPRDRLPLEAVVHEETYRDVPDEALLALYAAREKAGWERYMSHPESRARIEAAGIKNLAQFYPSDMKYGKKLHAETSRSMLELLKAKGFWNF